jgi:putative transposase
MKILNKIRTGRHCVFDLHVYLVFVTKYRKNIFTQAMLSLMQNVFADICLRFEASLVEFNGESDHVHLLIHYPPKLALSKLVNSLKGVSSRLLRTKFPQVQRYYWKGVLWSPSYFAASCGGAPIDIIREYIEKQKSPDC